MSIATATAQEPRTAPEMAQSETENWKQQTVGHFFARCNWENLELPLWGATVPGQTVPLDYSLSVGQFFGAIPWDGSALVVSVSTQAASSLAQPELELPSFEGEAVLDALPELEEIADESHLAGGDVTLDDFLGSFSL